MSDDEKREALRLRTEALAQRLLRSMERDEPSAEPEAAKDRTAFGARRKTQTVVRCPRCGSTNAGENEALSVIEFARMECRSCGWGEHVDLYQLKEEWNVQLALEPGAPLPAFVEPFEPQS